MNSDNAETTLLTCCSVLLSEFEESITLNKFVLMTTRENPSNVFNHSAIQSVQIQ